MPEEPTLNRQLRRIKLAEKGGQVPLIPRLDKVFGSSKVEVTVRTVSNEEAAGGAFAEGVLGVYVTDEQARIMTYASTALDETRTLRSGPSAWADVVEKVDTSSWRYSKAQIDNAKLALIRCYPVSRGLLARLLMTLLYYMSRALSHKTGALLRATLNAIASDALLATVRGMNADRALGKAILARKKELLALVVITATEAAKAAS